MRNRAKKLLHQASQAVHRLIVPADARRHELVARVKNAVCEDRRDVNGYGSGIKIGLDCNRGRWNV